MAAVAQLKGDPKYSAVYELLHIFSVEKLGEYMAFHQVRDEFSRGFPIVQPFRSI